ncbi:hypothetical protein LXL04_016653 [Taraxacum kok-saghyz]
MLVDSMRSRNINVVVEVFSRFTRCLPLSYHHIPNIHKLLVGPTTIPPLATTNSQFKKISRWHDDDLIKIERISWILSPSSSLPNDDSLRVSKEEDPENWHVQVFRSIDFGSLKGFPKAAQVADSQMKRGVMKSLGMYVKGYYIIIIGNHQNSFFQGYVVSVYEKKFYFFLLFALVHFQSLSKGCINYGN